MSTEARQVIPAAVTQITPMELLRVSVDRGDDLARIEKLMELERAWKADKAKEEFHRALAEFKKVHVVVTKDKENKQYSVGDKKAMYTSLGNLVNTVNAAMAPFGLSASWQIDQTNGIRVTCVLTHTLGHSMSVGLSGPPDSSGSKNPLQQIKSTITYLQAATFQAVTGVIAQDANSDDDGNDSDATYITADQATVITDKLGESGANKAQFLNWLKAEAVETILVADYERAVAQLDKKIAKKAAK